MLILTSVSQPTVIWRTLNDTRGIEMRLLERNSRHLPQTGQNRRGRCHDPIVTAMRGSHGLDLMEEVLNGNIEIPEAMQTKL